MALAGAKGALSTRAASLDALSPLASMARGFVACERAGSRLASVKALVPGDRVDVRFVDGRAGCVVDEVAVEAVKEAHH